jgi:hypothetical protein
MVRKISTPITKKIKNDCTNPARKLKEQAIKSGNISGAISAGVKETTCKVWEERTKITPLKKGLQK